MPLRRERALHRSRIEVSCTRTPRREAPAPATLMNLVKCPYCFSLNVTIVSADATRELVTVQCLECGKASEIDREQFTVDTEDLPGD